MGVMSLGLTELLFEDESFDVLNDISELFMEEEGEQADILARMSGLKFVGEGVSKVVYSYGKGRVVKFALHEYAKGELLDEVKNFSCSPDWFPQVFDIESSGGWAVVERVPITSKRVGKVELSRRTVKFLGLDEMDSYEEFLSEDGILQLHNLLFALNNKKIDKLPVANQKLKELVSVLKRCSIGFMDLKVDNFGFRKNGHMVIFDSMQDDLNGDFEEFR